MCQNCHHLQPQKPEPKHCATRYLQDNDCIPHDFVRSDQTDREAYSTQITPPTPTKEYRRSKGLSGFFVSKPRPLRASPAPLRKSMTQQPPPPLPLLGGGGRKGSTPLLGRSRRQPPATISVSTDNLATPFKKTGTSPLFARPTRTHSGVQRFPSTDLLFKVPAKRTKPSPLLGRSRGSLNDVRTPVTGQTANNNPVPPTPPPLPPRNGTMKRPSH